MGFENMSRRLQDIFLEQFGTSREGIANGECISCRAIISDKDFRDDLARREYEISLLCQACQDTVFLDEEGDDEANC